MAKQMIGARLEDEVIARIDAICEKLSTPWHQATRSDAVRALILLGLERLEQMESDETTAPPTKTAKQKRGGKSDQKK